MKSSNTTSDRTERLVRSDRYQGPERRHSTPPPSSTVAAWAPLLVMVLGGGALYGTIDSELRHVSKALEDQGDAIEKLIDKVDKVGDRVLQVEISNQHTATGLSDHRGEAAHGSVLRQLDRLESTDDQLERRVEGLEQSLRFPHP